MKTLANGRLVAFLAACAAAATASASEMLLDGALSEDKSLGEVVNRFKTVKEKQEESGVFSQGEISLSSETITGVDKVKTDNIKSVIQSLDRAATTSDGNVKAEGYHTARDEYGIAIKALEELAKKQAAKIERNMQKQELLERQKSLLDDLTKLDEEKKKDPKLDEKDLNKLAEMSAQQEELKNSAEDENIKKKMDEASQNLQDTKMKEAMKNQKEIVKELEKQIASESSQELQNSSQMDQANQQQSQMEEMAKQLEDSINGKDPLSNQERQDMAQKMDQMSQQMKQQEQQEQKQAAQQMQQAMENVLAQQDKNALQNLQNAMQQVQQAAKQMQQAMQAQQAQQQKQKKPQKPMDLPDSKQDEYKDGEGIESAIRSAAKSGSDWAARLPEKERNALLAARKAKYNENFDEEVRGYFTKLAQEKP